MCRARFSKVELEIQYVPGKELQDVEATFRERIYMIYEFMDSV